ncbi:hypothetical protein SGQ44_15910 [Flavobacterium sp. Fl-77]|uniref:Uncharacterized protein n=1 Tax=Flavobacterium flavipigmentatum TaxID=2893884 RepID=A0AAJ2SH91_9FLAO|nr:MULTISPECIES: hypothetical protein [unclassified Flavobacterium]MDX6183789.1 hypothetical protein [Flavobacterium sp. Fl-33]MDX6187250.1 hypothetical protein [Flavobacterium sp. Fl-77]UFH38065.1 hypothetical protein LNP22_15155 [Flavobacterium sp. F-70]
MKTFYTFFLFLICNYFYAQTDDSFIKEIKEYVIKIDSINKLDLYNTNYVISISDGIIEMNNKVVGGYGIRTLSDIENNFIYRINYGGGTDLYIHKTYYYQTNKLCYAVFEINDYKNKLGKIYLKEEFYKNDKKISSIVTVNKLDEKNRNETDISLFDDGVKYFNDKKNNSH